MVADDCAVCGKPLPARAGRTGRSSLYCSAACRQKAYRRRHGPEETGVEGLIEDLARQVKELAPTPPSVRRRGAGCAARPSSAAC